MGYVVNSFYIFLCGIFEIEVFSFKSVFSSLDPQQEYDFSLVFSVIILTYKFANIHDKYSIGILPKNKVYKSCH